MQQLSAETLGKSESCETRMESGFYSIDFHGKL
jgi:hypothetical protein